jgi:hypothetical protein
VGLLTPKDVASTVPLEVKARMALMMAIVSEAILALVEFVMATFPPLILSKR